MTIKGPDISARNIIFFAIIAVGLASLLSLLVSLYSLDGERKYKLSEAKISAHNMANALAQQATASLRIADVILHELGEMRVRELHNSPAVDIARRIFGQQAIRFAEIDNIILMDSAGTWIVSWPTTKRLKQPNSSDREYFLYHKQHRDLATRVGMPIRSRMTDNWVIPVTRRLEENGKFVGVAVVSMRIDFFSDAYNAFDVGRTGSLVLASSDGFVLYRRPYSTEILGKSMEDAPIYTGYAKFEASGSATIASSHDGIKRIHYYQRLNGYPAFVIAALGYDEVLSPWWQEVRSRLLIAFIIIVMICLLTYRLIALIRFRNRAIEQIQTAHDSLAAMNLRLEQLAFVDGLTGLANRRYLDEQAVKALRASVRSAAPIALIMIDVDHFKRFNDAYGHVQGDMCLQEISNIFKNTLHRPADLAARYGGEEFVILLPNTDMNGAARVAEEILTGIRHLGIPHEENEAKIVTISAGVYSVKPDANLTLSGLYASADTALYRAKNRGRDQFCCSGDEVLLESPNR